MPSTVDHLLAAVAADPSRPRLTWYDDATGERVELSGATLQTWVAKTTHLLDGELGVAAGSRVAVALPRHWTAAVWWLAVDAVGASLVVADPAVPVADPVDLVVVGPDLVADPGDAAEVVAVSLRPRGARARKGPPWRPARSGRRRARAQGRRRRGRTRRRPARRARPRQPERTERAWQPVRATPPASARSSAWPR